MFHAWKVKKSFYRKLNIRNHGKAPATQTHTSWNHLLWNLRSWIHGLLLVFSSPNVPTLSSSPVSWSRSYEQETHRFSYRWTKAICLHWQQVTRVRTCIWDRRCLDEVRWDPRRAEKEVSGLGDVPLKVPARAKGATVHGQAYQKFQSRQYWGNWPFRFRYTHSLGGVSEYYSHAQVPASHSRDDVSASALVWRRGFYLGQGIGSRWAQPPA